MGKAGRWLKSFLSGKQDRPQQHQQPEAMPVLAVLPPPTPKEKRWSFRRPVPVGKSAADAPAAGRGVSDEGVLLGVPASADDEFEQKKRAVAVAVATAAAADAAAAAANATAAAARLSSRRADYLPLPATRLVEDAAAVRIQATFRGYLARTALCALRGIVKLQALVRGQLVRKQATATLRCMQALLAAQSQLRAQRMMRVLQEQHHQTPPSQPPRPRQSSPQHPRHHCRSYEMDRFCEEDNAKIVEVDVGSDPARRGAAAKTFVDQYHHHGRCSPAPSQAMTELSPRAYSSHFDEFSLATAKSSPYHAASTELLCPSYMANTESSRAKQARSQSVPRQRSTDALERLPSRRKGTTPPRYSSASSRMQRSSSLVGGAGAGPPRGGWGGQSPSAWSAVRLDVSNASLKDSECGSTTSSVLTAATVYSRTRSLVGLEVRRGMY